MAMRKSLHTEIHTALAEKAKLDKKAKVLGAKLEVIRAEAALWRKRIRYLSAVADHEESRNQPAGLQPPDADDPMAHE